LSDAHGRVRVYGILVGIATVVTLGITHSGRLPAIAIVALAASFFVFASGRFIPAQAISSLAVPPRRRGAFMSLNSCARDVMAGVTATVGGWLVGTRPDGTLVGYDRLGWIAVLAALISLWIAHKVRNVEPPRGALGSRPESSE
jgi:predicted MFS family arabinose efflux permease